MKAQFLAMIRKKVNIVILALFAVVLITGFWLMLRPKEVYRFEGSFTPAPGVVLREEPIYEDISLRPGVYQVELSYETKNPMGYLCTAKDETVFHGGLLTNGENLYGGKGKTGYLMWLLEPTDRLDICLSYEGDFSLTTGDLIIRETGYMGSILFAGTMLVGLLYIGLMLYRSYDLAGCVSKEQKKAIFGVAVISLIASIPFLLGVSLNGADLTFHLHRIEGIADGLRSGQFPVRIEPEWVHGHGYACGIFYCNILFYFPALLRLAGFPITFSYNIFCVVLNVATAIVSYGVFRRIFTDRNIGLVCSALYTLSGMRIFKTVMTGGPGENGALLFLPLVVYGFWALLAYETEDIRFKKSWIPLSVGFAGLIQTHILTCELTAFVSVLVCLVCCKRVFAKSRFLMLCKGAFASLVMTAWFVVPMLDFVWHENVHVEYISGRTIQEAGLVFRDLFFRWGLSPTGVGFYLALVLVLFGVLWITGKCKKEAKDIFSLGKISLCLCVLLMIMSLQVFPWNKIQALHPILASLISSIQFPYRFLGWANVFGILLVGCCLWYMRQHNKRTGYRLLMLGAVLSITAFSLHQLEYVSKYQGTYVLYNVEGMGRGYISGAEYVIEGTVDTELMYRDALPDENVVISNYDKGSLRAEFDCVNTGKEAGYVDLPLLLYRGYRAYNPATGEALDLFYGENNTVCVEIPVGFNGQVLVRHVPLWYWRVAEAVTLLGYGVWIWRCKVRKK